MYVGKHLKIVSTIGAIYQYAGLFYFLLNVLIVFN